MTKTRRFLAFSLLGAIGCGSELEESAKCDQVTSEAREDSTEASGSRPRVAIVSAVAAADGTSLVLTGTASHPKALALRNIFVESLEVTKASSNFRQWTVTVPEGVWRAAIADDNVSLDAIVADPCGEWHLTLETPIPEEYQPMGEGGSGGS